MNRRGFLLATVGVAASAAVPKLAVLPDFELPPLVQLARMIASGEYKHNHKWFAHLCSKHIATVESTPREELTVVMDEARMWWANGGQ